MANQVSTETLIYIATIPVAVGTVLTALFTTISQSIVSRRAHKQWLKEKRYDAYKDLVHVIAEIHSLVARGGRSSPRGVALAERYGDAITQCVLVDNDKKKHGELLANSTETIHSVLLNPGHRKAQDRLSNVTGSVLNSLEDKLRRYRL